VRSLLFSGASTDYGYSEPGPLTTLTDNVGIEAWVNPLAPTTGAALRHVGRDQCHDLRQ
jgi:hypothetical protein